MSEFSIGPSIPPAFRKKSEEEPHDEASEIIGPVLPSVSMPDATAAPRIGPQMPSSLAGRDSSEKATSVGGEFEDRHQDARQDVAAFGPVCTPSDDKSSYGPSLPPRFDTQSSSGESDEDDIIGPVPMMERDKNADSLERVRKEIESRSKSMKDKLTGQSSEPQGPQREEWMTELPPGIKPLGTGARKFRSTAQELGDRSVWTDTPADRMRKAQEAHQRQARTKAKPEKHNFLSGRDKELEKQVSDHNQEYRGQSLMDMHRKRKAEEGGGERGGEERRPFDRERDLALPKTLITPAKRRALEKDSAKALHSKFMHGSNAFL